MVRCLAPISYHLDVARRRSGRDAEAVRRFNEAVDAWSDSISGQGAAKELSRRSKDPDAAPDGTHVSL
jgi:hypothetical protein